MADHSNSVTCTNESRRRGEGTIVDSEAGRDAGWNLRDTLEPPMQTPVALYGSSESCNADLADARRFHDEVTKKGIKGRGSRSSVKRVPARRQSSSHNRKSFADPQRSTTPTTSNPIKGVNKEASDRIPPHLRARLEAPAQSCASPHRTAHLPWKPKESVAAAYSSDKPSAASSADKSLAAPSSDESLGKSSPTSKNNVSSFADTALNSPSHREDSRESPSSNDGTGIDQSSIGQITDLPATSPTVKPKSAPERVDGASHKGNLPPIATEIKSTVAMAQGTPVSPPHPLQYRVDFTHQVPQHSVVIPPPPNGIQLSDPHRSIQSASHITMNASHAYAAADHLHGLQTISRPSPYRSNPGMQALPSHAIYDQVAPYPAQDQHSVWPSSTPMPSTPDQASWQTSPPGLPYVPSTQSHGFWRSVVPVIPSWTSLGPPTFPAHHEMPSAYTFDHGQKPVGFFVDDSPPSPVPDHLSAPSSGVSSLKMINGYSAFPTALDTVAAGQQLPQSSQHNQTQLLMNGGIPRVRPAPNDV
ncbi:uncharacterized protein K489DRAFT_268859 [Dissoconium aciculare CBS 342.82]|uniref:Uncharacterized protein n=1 Tax=Dissoconium aciculare CBS 342.82 TaxID=1314786 RepID=A0A6J3M120_9PEZI|nr:uncharacterized protein K489DRAFT_268859 [Dissoconium aciculare CBS 342.82]KAF1821204.1 hypothetical protein K489DRAFT_268859 [Dissoconium aciculare CBS 342.82]